MADCQHDAGSKTEGAEMTDDLVKRLRDMCGDNGILAIRDIYDHDVVEAADRIEKLKDELHHCFHRIEELQAALRNIAEGDILRAVKIPFRDDGQSSKHDRCKHGQWFYEDCGCCIEDYARKALEDK